MVRMDPCRYCGEYIFFDDCVVGDIIECDECGSGNLLCEGWSEEDLCYLEYLALIDGE